MASGLPVMKSGTYTGAAAAVTVQVGFRPNYIVGINTTDGQRWEWSDQMSGTVVLKDTSAGTAMSTETITILDHGFTVPASGAASNINTKAYVYLAFRDGSN